MQSQSCRIADYQQFAFEEEKTNLVGENKNGNAINGPFLRDALGWALITTSTSPHSLTPQFHNKFQAGVGFMGWLRNRQKWEAEG